MKGNELRSVLEFLELNQTQAANLLRVAPRSVRRWIADEAEIPGPVEVALETFLLAGIPRKLPGRPKFWRRPSRRFSTIADALGTEYVERVVVGLVAADLVS